MNKLEILAITALLFLIGSVWAAHSWRKKPAAVEPDPGPILPPYDYNDPDPPTMPMAKLMPFVDDIRRAERNKGREEGRAEALAEKAERPPWMKPLDKSRAARRDSKADEQHAGYHPERDN